MRPRTPGRLGHAARPRQTTMSLPHISRRSLRIAAVAVAVVAVLAAGSAAFAPIPFRLPLDSLATYAPQTRCDARPKPAVVAFRKLVLERHPGSRDLGIINNCAPGLISEHYEGRAWDWGETGTQHRPGIQPADVAELLEHAPEVVVLSRGRELRLETSPEAMALLDSHGLEVVQTETGAAIAAYNRLADEGRRVAALLHSTC